MSIKIWEPKTNSLKRTINRNKEFWIKLLRIKREELKFSSILTKRKRMLINSSICLIKYLHLSSKCWSKWLDPNLTDRILIESRSISILELISMTPIWLSICLNLKSIPTAFSSIRAKLANKLTLKFMLKLSFWMN